MDVDVDDNANFFSTFSAVSVAITFLAARFFRTARFFLGAGLGDESFSDVCDSALGISSG